MVDKIVNFRSGDRYVDAAQSPTFPDLPIATLIPQLVQNAIERGTSRMLRDLRTRFR